ncbi:hypothetical protein [Coxiella endosymbiont of Ornithodoros amblus]|nr:hypothetical protein [Coxiella endosymbiont of Ornithodoros amblus]
MTKELKLQHGVLREAKEQIVKQFRNQAKAYEELDKKVKLLFSIN